jgi:hypothetical protein
MKIHSRLVSSIGLTLLAACAGGAREVGQQAVQNQRNANGTTTAGTNGTSSGSGAEFRVIAATGAASGAVNRPVSMGRDEAPTLVTLQGRAMADNRARNVAVDPASVPGVVPSSGGYIVRRAGGASGGAATSGARSGGDGVRAATFESETVSGALVRADGDATRTRVEATGPSRPAREEARRAPLAQSTNMVPGRGEDASSSGSTRLSAGGRTASASGSGYGGGGAASAGMRAPMDDMPAADRAAPPASRVMPVAPITTPITTPGARPMPVGVIPTGTTVTVTTTVAVTPPVIVEPQQETAGLLTAATVGDADRFTNYIDYLNRHTAEAGELRLDMSRRLRIRVVDSQGRGVNAARVRLSNQGGTVEALTHADGSYDYFPGLSTAQLSGVARLDVQVESLSVGADVQIPTQGDGQPVMVRLNAAVVPPAPVLDLGFVIDVTGSMGDELRYINREIASIVQRIERDAPGVRVRLSATFYRDRVDEAVVQQIPFTTNVQGFAAAMQNVYATGGGDYPEDMSAGLDAALNRLAWSDGAAVRVLVLVADAPPQHYGDTNFTYREAMVRAAQRGIRLLPVAASGSDRRVEFLFRAMGAYTSTPYVYLTDDSGIGGSHMEADTDRVAVERFNDALVRLIVSDLRGEGMHEPGRLGAERN